MLILHFIQYHKITKKEHFPWRVNIWKAYETVVRFLFKAADPQSNSSLLLLNGESWWPWLLLQLPFTLTNPEMFVTFPTSVCTGHDVWRPFTRQCQWTTYRFFSPDPFFPCTWEELETYYAVILLLKVLIPIVPVVCYRAVTRCSALAFWFGSRPLEGISQCHFPPLGSHHGQVQSTHNRPLLTKTVPERCSSMAHGIYSSCRWALRPLA